MIKRVIIAFFSLCSLNAAVYGSCLPNRFQKYSVGYHWDTLSFPAHKFSLKVCNDDSLGRSIFFSYGGEDFETFVQMDSTKILWEDIDFDGFEDALILVDVASNTSYESFLFDSKNKQYMHLRTIRNTALDKKRKMLLYSIHMGGGESSLYGFKIHKQKEYSIFIAHKRNETVRIFDNKMNLILTNNKGEELDEVTENILESTPSIWKNVTQEPRQLLDWAEFWKMLDKLDKNKIVPNNK